MTRAVAGNSLHSPKPRHKVRAPTRDNKPRLRSVTSDSPKIDTTPTLPFQGMASDCGSAVDNRADAVFATAVSGSHHGRQWDTTSRISSAVDDRAQTVFETAASGSHHETQWDTTSRIISVIDDTRQVHRVFNRSQRYASRSQPTALPGGLLRKLAKASIEEKRAARAAEDEARKTKEVDLEKTQRNKAEERAAQIKAAGLFIPTNAQVKGVRIQDQGARYAVPKTPTPAPQKQKELEATGKASSPSSEPAAERRSSPSVVSAGKISTTRTVRILGKNGEEAFMEIPIIATSLRPASRVVSVVATLAKPEKKQQKAAAAAKAKKRGEQDEKKARTAFAKTVPMTSGHESSARPTFQAPGRSKASSAPSQKDSAYGSGLNHFDAANDTGIPSSWKQASVLLRRGSMSGSKKSAPATYQEQKPPSTQALENVYAGNSQRPDSHHGDKGSGPHGRTNDNANRPSSHQYSANDWIEIKQNSPRSQAQSGPHNSSKQDTVFAGAGWITPHPLSPAASVVQSAIPVPVQGMQQLGTMTYDEWKAQHRQPSGSQESSGRYEAAVESVHSTYRSPYSQPMTFEAQPQQGREPSFNQASVPRSPNWARAPPMKDPGFWPPPKPESGLFGEWPDEHRGSLRAPTDGSQQLPQMPFSPVQLQGPGSFRAPSHGSYQTPSVQQHYSPMQAPISSSQPGGLEALRASLQQERYLSPTQIPLPLSSDSQQPRTSWPARAPNGGAPTHLPMPWDNTSRGSPEPLRYVPSYAPFDATETSRRTSAQTSLQSSRIPSEAMRGQAAMAERQFSTGSGRSASTGMGYQEDRRDDSQRDSSARSGGSRPSAEAWRGDNGDWSAGNGQRDNLW